MHSFFRGLALVIYLVTTAVAARASTIGVFIGMRLGQALGSSAVLALGAGSLADIYDVSCDTHCSCKETARNLTKLLVRTRPMREERNWGYFTRETLSLVAYHSE